MKIVANYDGLYLIAYSHLLKPIQSWITHPVERVTLVSLFSFSVHHELPLVLPHLKFPRVFFPGLVP